MKKLFNLSLAIAALSIVFSFSSCANASNSPGNDVIPTTPIEVTVPATTTSGSVTAATTDSNGNKTATLSASNGSYTFTESSNANVNTSILSRAAFVDNTKNGVWTFSETGSSIPKYSGTYYGNISQFSSIEVKLTLIINKVLDNGSLKNVTENQIFSMEATTSTFHATIPEVKVMKNEVTELALNNEEIDNKIFRNKYNNKYTLFTNNKCYIGSEEYSARSLHWPQTDITVIKVDGKLYKAKKVSYNGNISYYSQAKDELIFHTSYKNAFTGKVFVNAEKNKIVAFKTSGQVFSGLNVHVNYSVSGNTAKTEPFPPASPNDTPRSISYTISGTTLTSDQDKNITLTQISGDNGFGGKAFYNSNTPFEKRDDPSYPFYFPYGFFIFESNTSLLVVNLKGFNTIERTSYTVDGTTATATVDGKIFNFTISGNKITATFDSKSVTADQVL